MFERKGMAMGRSWGWKLKQEIGTCDDGDMRAKAGDRSSWFDPLNQKDGARVSGARSAWVSKKTKTKKRSSTNATGD